MSQGHLDCAII